MKLRTLIGGVAACLFTASALAIAGYTTVEHEHLTSSLIDSTGIGAITPSTGVFTTLQANGTLSATNGLVVSGSNGITDTGNLTVSGSALVNGGNVNANGFVTNNQAGGIIAGFGTFNGTVSANNFNSPGAVVGSNGISDAGNLTVGGSALVNGGNITAGGFVTSNSQTGGVVAGYGSYYGNVTASSFSGPLNGNAATATSLANGGGTCPSGGYSAAGYSRPVTGISAAGAVTCGPLHEWVYTNSTCTAGGSSYSTCSVTLNWPLAFPDAAYAVVCQGLGATGPQSGAMTVQVGATTPSQVAVIIANEASNAGGSFGALHCEADHI